LLLLASHEPAGHGDEAA